MSKRAHGEGTITQRGDGRWAAALTVEGGKRTWVYGPTQRDVKAKLDTLKRAQQDGLPATSSRLTVGAFLADWLTVAKPTLKPRTYIRYEQLVRVHLLPALGKIVLSRLESRDLSRLYDNKGSTLATQTVNHTHVAAHIALAYAVKTGKLFPDERHRLAERIEPRDEIVRRHVPDRPVHQPRSTRMSRCTPSSNTPGRIQTV